MQNLARPGISFALLFLVGACEKEKPQAPPPPPQEVNVAKPLQQDVPIYFEVIGETRGNTEIEIRARVEGFIETIDFEQGKLVKKGDLLYTLDPRPFNASLAQAKAAQAEAEAQLARAEQDVARYAPLVEKNAISRQVYETSVAVEKAAAAAVDATKAMVEQAQIDLSYTKILAPEAGLVGKTEVYAGTLVGRGQSTLLTRISRIDPIHARASIAERDYLAIARRVGETGKEEGKGASFQLILADRSVFPQTGKLVFLDRNVDARTGTIMFEAAFPNPDHLLRPGQYARVRCQMDVAKGGLLVPQRAVQELQGAYFVMAVGADGVVAQRMVTTAERVGPLWRIASGLKADEQVIVDGLQKVRPGIKVTAKVVSIDPDKPPPDAKDDEKKPEQHEGKKWPMAQFFIRRPIVAIVISILIVMMGAATLQGLSIEQYPFLAPPMIRVTANYPGASAVAVEQSVATPVEQEVNGVDRMIYMKSSNTSDGRMQLDVNFEVGVDQDNANVLTQNRVSAAQARLPQEVVQQGVTVKKQSPSILMILSVYSPEGAYDANFLINYCGINLRDQLLRIPGIAQVDLFGGTDYGMRIWLRPDRLAQLGITPADVVSVIREQNLLAPGGKIGGEPAPKGQQFTYTVSAPGRLLLPEEFENIIVRETDNGAQIRIRDIGRAELGAQNYDSFGRLNGKPAGSMAVYLLPGANQLKASEAIYETMHRAHDLFPPDVDYKIVYDTTPAVEASIESIVHTFIEAVILVTLVVFFFLQNLRATLIPLLTVPVSLIGTFIFFPMLGFSVNTLSMFGLVLAIGIVVDDAIVVVEAVMHHIEHGKSPKDATIQAMKEVSAPVIGIALILSAVFVPVAMLGGLTGQMYQQFALTIAISVLLSAFSALSLSPALAAMLLKPAKPMRGPLGAFFKLFNKTFDVTTKGYIGVTGILVRRSFLTIVLVGGVVLGAGVFGSRLSAGFIPEEDQGLFGVMVQLPPGASLQRTSDVLGKVEHALSEIEGVESYTTIGGYGAVTASYQPNFGTVFARLKPWGERKGPDLHVRGIIKTMQQKLRSIPEAIAFPFNLPTISGFGASAGFNFLLQDRSGSMSVAQLGERTAEFLATARARPELANLFTSFDPNYPQVGVELDRDKARKLGIPINEAFTAMSAALGSAYVNDFNRFGRLFRVYVQAEGDSRSDPLDIGKIHVRSESTGDMVPLSTITTITAQPGAEITNRFNLFRSVEISGVPGTGFSSGQALSALEAVFKEKMPPEMSFAYSSLSYQEKVAPPAGPTLLMAILCVFLLLAAMYESWRLPWAVLLGSPLVALGAFFGVWLTGFDNNVYVQVGLIMLIGLAAKNAILIVEFAKAKHDEGMPLQEAALESARLRFRPILMTAFAFILGVVPLMLASGAGAGAQNVMGTAVFWGMLVATFFGVFLIPGNYTFVEQLWRRKQVVAAASPPDDPTHTEPPATGEAH